MGGPLVVLVNGLSATGKTTVGRKLAEALGLPYFAKDAVKERLFDALGYSDRAWAHKLSGATHSILNYVMEEELRVGRGFLIEANFNPQHDPAKFNAWRERYDARLVQVLCFADGQVVFDRFKKRIDDGLRHPGHVDHLNVEAFRGYLLQGKCAPLDINAPVIEVDTTDFAKISISDLATAVQQASL